SQWSQIGGRKGKGSVEPKGRAAGAQGRDVWGMGRGQERNARKGARIEPRERRVSRRPHARRNERGVRTSCASPTPSSSGARRYGSSVVPIRYRSHSRAAPRPSLIAQTTKLCPRRQSPAANTPSRLVVNLPCSAL